MTPNYWERLVQEKMKDLHKIFEELEKQKPSLDGQIKEDDEEDGKKK